MAQLVRQETAILGYLLLPFLIKGIKFIQGGLFIYCGIDFFEACHEFFNVFVGDEFGGVTDLVDVALLDLVLGYTASMALVNP